MEYSSDGLNWDVSHEYTLTAGVFTSPSRAPPLQYYRCRVVNGDTAQTYMRLSSVFRPITHSPTVLPGTAVFGPDVNSTALQVSNESGVLESLTVTNSDSVTAIWIKLYNMNSSPNPALDTPIAQFLVAESASPFTFNPPKGLYFSAGCFVRAVSGEGDTDTTGASSNTCQVLAMFKADE
jgi:hypothetical protein